MLQLGQLDERQGFTPRRLVRRPQHAVEPLGFLPGVLLADAQPLDVFLQPGKLLAGRLGGDRAAAHRQQIENVLQVLADLFLFGRRLANLVLLDPFARRAHPLTGRMAADSVQSRGDCFGGRGIVLAQLRRRPAPFLARFGPAAGASSSWRSARVSSSSASAGGRSRNGCVSVRRPTSAVRCARACWSRDSWPISARKRR